MVVDDMIGQLVGSRYGQGVCDVDALVAGTTEADLHNAPRGL